MPYKVHPEREQKQPNERDETPDPPAAPRGVIEQAAKDLERGLVDTDLHGERGAEAAVAPKTPQQATPLARRSRGMRSRKAP